MTSLPIVADLTTFALQTNGIMDGKAMEALAKRFPGWEFVVATPSGWRISATDDRAATQASELVGQLRALNPEGDLEIRIHGSRPIIDLLERKAKKYRRMYTSGCFDVFHFGLLRNKTDFLFFYQNQ